MSSIEFLHVIIYRCHYCFNVYLLAAPTSPIDIERTEVFYGSEDAMKILLQAMRNVKKEAVTCSDAQSAGFFNDYRASKTGLY